LPAIEDLKPGFYRAVIGKPFIRHYPGTGNRRWQMVGVSLAGRITPSITRPSKSTITISSAVSASQSTPDGLIKSSF
jgi:hypothetical protein